MSLDCYEPTSCLYQCVGGQVVILEFHPAPPRPLPCRLHDMWGATSHTVPYRTRNLETTKSHEGHGVMIWFVKNKLKL